MLINSAINEIYSLKSSQNTNSVQVTFTIPSDIPNVANN